MSVGDPAHPDPYYWPDFSMHMVHITGGKVLVWFSPTPGNPQPWLWDPDARPGQQLTSINADLPIGCSGHAQLIDGSALIAGGQSNVNCLAAVNNVTKFLVGGSGGWAQGANMVWKRWYPTCTTLDDRRIFVVGGDYYPEPVAAPPPPPCECFHGTCPFVLYPEVYDPITNTWDVLDAAQPFGIYYPLMFLGPNGRPFYAGPGIYTSWFNLQTEQ